MKVIAVKYVCDLRHRSLCRNLRHQLLRRRSSYVLFALRFFLLVRSLDCFDQFQDTYDIISNIDTLNFNITIDVQVDVNSIFYTIHRVSLHKFNHVCSPSLASRCLLLFSAPLVLLSSILLY